jgi:hypothetical protein
MSSIDERDGFPDDPLSRVGIAIFVGAGILLVGMLLVTGINALFPLRPPSLALRFLLPTWLVEITGRLEQASPGTWHRHHSVTLLLIVLFYVAGPIVLSGSIWRLLSTDPNHASPGSRWLTGLGIATGSGLTFFALFGPLITVPRVLIDTYTTQSRFDRLYDRTVLSADMQMMALKAQALYHRATDTLTVWAGDTTTPPISLSKISTGEPVLQSLLTGDGRIQRSYFVLSVLHPDTLLIYGKRGNEGTVFDRTAVLNACDRGDAPPGIYVTPTSWKWTFG